MRVIAIALLLAIPAVVQAQDSTAAPQPAPVAAAPAMVRPGMTEAEVVSTWGEPASTKTIGEWKYLFYRNYNERYVGWMDVVFLHRGQVVDCIARGEGRYYAGQSSAPPDRIPAPTLRSDTTTSGAVTGVRIQP